MTCQFKARALAGAVALSLVAAGASAGTVDLTYMGTTATNPKTVKITNSPVDEAATHVYAHGFRMRTDAADPLTEFLAWCLDIASLLGTGSAFDYNITDTPFSNSFGLDPLQLGRVQGSGVLYRPLERGQLRVQVPPHLLQVPLSLASLPHFHAVYHLHLHLSPSTRLSLSPLSVPLLTVASFLSS